VPSLYIYIHTLSLCVCVCACVCVRAHAVKLVRKKTVNAMCQNIFSCSTLGMHAHRLASPALYNMYTEMCGNYSFHFTSNICTWKAEVSDHNMWQALSNILGSPLFIIFCKDKCRLMRSPFCLLCVSVFVRVHPCNFWTSWLVFT
jgi:hypothetical protein